MGKSKKESRVNVILGLSRSFFLFAPLSPTRRHHVLIPVKQSRAKTLVLSIQHEIPTHLPSLFFPGRNDFLPSYLQIRLFSQKKKTHTFDPKQAHHIIPRTPSICKIRSGDPVPPTLVSFSLLAPHRDTMDCHW